MLLKKVSLGDHRHCIGMADHRTTVPLLDRRRVGYVIPVAVGQHEEINFFITKVKIDPLRRVEENPPLGSLHEKAICFVSAACIIFELKHDVLVQPRGLIFLAQSTSRDDQLTFPL